ncbi:hypothetical protein EDD99_7007 [Streptomyces sp. 846.5]|nr:hypothetical protein [Streptomyces sp. 846.5]TDT98776.1 hypothetical protein EDD99_7007 [Streptomyces sp. 846.5]
MPSLPRPIRHALRRRPRAHHDINDLARRRYYRAPRRRLHPVRGLLVNLAVLVLLPLWPFIAYPLQRAGSPRGRRQFLWVVTHHSVVIALSAPMRYLADRLHRLGGRGGGPRRNPPFAGDREPRRPKSGPPSDAIALPEPRG